MCGMDEAGIFTTRLVPKLPRYIKIVMFKYPANVEPALRGIRPY